MSNVPPAQLRQRFPLARKAYRFAIRARGNWLERHQNSFNFGIHMLGIPVACAGVVLLFFVEWYWGVSSLVLGYFLQWLGHRVEGNDVGELIPVKKLFGLPVVSVVPAQTASAARSKMPT